MVSLDQAVIGRLSKGKEQFEILVDPVLALEFKKGHPVSIERILAVNEIFKDAKKGERAADSALKEHFHHTDKLKIAEEIISKGEIQFTVEQRRKMIEDKRKEIADIISRHGINPQTKLPHPPLRIMNAMEEAHVNIEPFRPAKEQVDGVVKKIQSIIPISIQTLEVALKVPLQYAGKISSQIRNIATLKSEQWKSDAWYALIEIPAGMQSDIYNKLNNLTNGNVDVKVIKQI